LKIKVPTYWTENKSAGVDWFKNFLKRNSTLSICQPESTSLARAINLNPVNANMFMDKYDSQLNKYKFEAHPTVLIVIFLYYQHFYSQIFNLI